MAQSIIGARIRERRRAIGMTQADLARSVGISASYLNLIEKNRRGIAGKRLSEIAAALGLKLADLDGAAERRLHDTLDAVAADPRLAGLGIESDAVGEMIGRLPGWAKAIGALARSERESADLIRALTDRLTHDPFLGESVHKMLTRIAAIRSTAEILDTVPDIEDGQSARFHAILAEESRTLSSLAEALAAYFDRAETATPRVTPTDEVEALFEVNENRFEAIERALESAPVPTESAARAAVELRAGPVIDRLIAEAPTIETEPARQRARRALFRYGIDAIRAPLAPFAETATRHCFDLDRLVEATALPADLICRRLTTLTEGPRFGCLSVNGAGALIELRTVAGFNPVRHAALCPLWALARAPQSPERALRQLVTLPNGRRFVFVARARALGSPGFGQPRHLASDLLVLPEAEATRTVYTCGPPGTGVAEEVGLTCRICPRRRCEHRVDDPLE
ncbi:MAG: short-chain fatty acyl-CoA regulator family protein [Pseudomonadota bacterium]